MVLTRADFQPDISPMEETLEQVKSTLRQHFEIKDWQGVDIILATAVAHYIPGEMLWLRFFGPSRSGIEQQRQLEGLLGQRFIDLRWQPGNREEMAIRISIVASPLYLM